jgi:hypothetical protein
MHALRSCLGFTSETFPFDDKAKYVTALALVTSASELQPSTDPRVMLREVQHFQRLTGRAQALFSFSVISRGDGAFSACRLLLKSFQ